MNPQIDFFERLVASQDLGSKFNGDEVSFILCLIISVLFGLMLKTLYSLYFLDNEPQDGSLARSLVLLTPSLTASFWMIQHSLILSIGLLGSLSFVRFRTPVKRAEDISFILIMVAVSLSCAIELYVFGVSLIGILFIYSFARNHFERFFGGEDRYAIVTFNTKRLESFAQIKDTLDSVRVRHSFVSSRSYDGVTSFVFKSARVNKITHDLITNKLSGLDPEAHINIFYPNDRIGA